MAGKHRMKQLIIFVLASVILGTLSIEVYPDGQWVNVTIGAKQALLPCHYRTNNNSKLIRIGWNKYGLSGGQIISQDDTGGIQVDGKYVGRVQFSSQTSLLLLSPTPTDVGWYACTITVDNDVPPSASAQTFLNLIVEEQVTGECSAPNTGIRIGFTVVGLLLHGLFIAMLIRWIAGYFSSHWQFKSWDRKSSFQVVTAELLNLIGTCLLGVMIPSECSSQADDMQEMGGVVTICMAFGITYASCIFILFIRKDERKRSAAADNRDCLRY